MPSLLVAPLVGSYATRIGNRPFLVIGMALHTAGMAWFALVANAAAPYLTLCGPLVLSGIGLSCVFPTVSGEVVSAVPPERMGVAAGVNGSLRELGGVLGVALAATVFAGAGGFATTSSFTTGFVHAIWACAVFAGAGVVAALLAAPRAADREGIGEPGVLGNTGRNARDTRPPETDNLLTGRSGHA